MDNSLLLAVALIPALVIAIVFHEVSHGWVALALGDPTAQEQRRLSLNPLRHVDPIGTLLLPGALALAGLPVFGWAKPVPVDKRRLDNPRFGMMAVAIAGPGMNLLLAALGAVVLGLAARGLDAEPQGVLGVAFASLNYFILINVFLALFNLIPLPPFDGSHVVEGLLPGRAAQAYARLRPYGFPLLIGLLVVLPMLFPHAGIVERFVLPPVDWIQQRFFDLAQRIAG